MEVKFNICDKVAFFNSAEGKLQEGKIKSVNIVATSVSKDEKGEDVLDSCVVLYQIEDGMWLTEKEVFADKDSAREYYKNLFSDTGF